MGGYDEAALVQRAIAGDAGACGGVGEVSVSYLGDELVSYRQVDYWVRVGLLHPTNPLPGSGGVRSWSPGEVAVARVMARLVRVGLSLRVAHAVARGERVLGPGIRIVVDDGNGE